MWDEDEGGGDDDEEEEDEALAGQLLSDLISSKKYGTNTSPVNYRRTFVSGHLSFLVWFCFTDDDYYEDDDDDDDDADALKDPIYQIDLQVHKLLRL